MFYLISNKHNYHILNTKFFEKLVTLTFRALVFRFLVFRTLILVHRFDTDLMLDTLLYSYFISENRVYS